ncbi:MAG: cell division protein FtsZ [Holosporales bacterium]|jgi:cell division protein FtsZ|nr:cell division protein FtsZ [Holosporales bacterium]
MSKTELSDVVNDAELGPKIVVIGVGGAGGNAVNNMIRSNLEGVTFVVANTDAQALKQSLASHEQRIQLGLSITQGLGAGSKPDVGRAAAEESSESILKFIDGTNMLFITAGMGGGTGTGAAPTIARIARDAGILTVGVVTKPFLFEGANRARTAEKGIEELQQYVDTLLIIPNQNLFRLANEDTTFADAFKMADNVLYSGVRGVTDLMIMPGLINLDFADIRAIMSEMGKAMMGTGEADGDRRALDAAEAAISNPLLDDVSLQGARGILINITGGYDMTLFEVDEAANRIREEVDVEANIIFGSTFDERLNGKIRVSVVATGIGIAQENIFKGRDIADIVGINKQEATKIFDNLTQKHQPIPDELATEPSVVTQEDAIAASVELDPYENTLDFEQAKTKKRSSFFDRFAAKSRQHKPYESYNSPVPQQLQQDHPTQEGRENPANISNFKGDELDIPACFRKKK